ncbi:MAG: exonuclease SbcCD subunit D [Pyrobaculum sp.]
MKILHISDAHLGRAQYHLPEREEDYFSAFEEALRRGKAADAVLVTGDLFDSRRPPTKAVVRFIEAVEASGLPVYVIGGNHDFNYLRFKAEAERCPTPRECIFDTVLRLVDRVRAARLLCWEAADLGGVVIYGACATPRDFAAEYRQRLLKAPPGSVLAIHQAVEGVKARYPAEEDEFTMPQEVFQGLPYLHIAAGHVHDHLARHPVGALWAGSLEIWDVGEFETWDYAGRWEKAQDLAPKGAVLLDAAGKAVSHKAVPLPPRRGAYRVRIYARDKNDLATAFEEAVKMFDKAGALVRVEIYGVFEGGVKPRQLASRFSKALYVDVVDRSSAPQKALALRGSAMEEIWRIMKERLGERAEAVLKAMELVRDGDREAAYRLLLKALYD